MIPRMHRNRVNLLVRQSWISMPKVQWSSPVVRTSAAVCGLVVLLSGLSFGYRFGQKTAASFCQIPKVENSKGSDASSSNMARIEAAVSGIQKDLENRMKQIPGVVALQRDSHSSAFQVILESDAFFRTGTASLEQKSEMTARKIASLLRAFLSRTVVEIQGHTDDSPVVRQKNLYRSNWELSLARAASMLHVFEEAGFVKDKLKVVGYGDSRPLVPNRTRAGVAIEENLSKNRRIVLKIIPEGKTEGH